MTIETSIPETSSDAQYDAYAKKITENQWVLAQIVQHVLPELKDYGVEEVMAMISSEIQRRVPLEPGQTNDPSSDPNSRLMGLNTEDRAPAEGAVFFDFVFRMLLPNQKEPSLLAVMVDIELMRQLSSKYELGDRKQVYASRSLGSQVGRNITDQRYSDAQPVISIWLCFNRPVNTFTHGYYVEESSSGVDQRTGKQKHDDRLEAKRSLMHVYTIGFDNNGPDEGDEAHRELFLLLAALYSATMGKDDKLRILHEHFGLRELESSQRKAIEEDVAMIDTLEAGMRRDFGVRIAKLSSALNAKDELLRQETAKKDAVSQALAEQSQALIKKDQAIDTLNLGFKEQEEKIRQLEAEIARLKGDQM